LIGSRKQCTYFVIKHEYVTIGDREKLQWDEDNWNDILWLWDIGSQSLEIKRDMSEDNQTLSNDEINFNSFDDSNE
jgi:predicted component of type VI protein secretion system